MGVYFDKSIYGIKCVNDKDQVSFEITRPVKYTDEEIDQIYQFINNFVKPCTIYIYKSYSTTHELNLQSSFMWVKN
jgi:hypothetical protein